MYSGIVFDDQELQKVFSRFTLPAKKKVPPSVDRKKVLVISGPTAVGKTALSLSIARQIGGEIISADSMQVYKGMDIGTAKATTAERAGVPHHLIDSRDLNQSFNVVDFYTEATKLIKEIHQRGHFPIVVGGTGFYIHALLYGPPSGPPSLPEMRKRLEHEMKQQGSFALYERLRKLDPEYAMTITPADRHKIIRALEIIALSNQKVSSFEKESSSEQQDYDFRCWFLYLNRDHLYKKIEERCDKMIEEGFIDEVRFLEKNGLRQNVSAQQAIGYRQCLDYLDSNQTETDYETFITNFKKVSRRYAKRQFTWFRKETLFRWIDAAEYEKDDLMAQIIQDIELSF